MAAKRERKKRRAKPQPAAQEPRRAVEPRGVEALTVLWMLTAVATLAAEAAAGAVWLFVANLSPTAEGPTAFSVLPSVLLFTALVTGTLCLGLTPVVVRLRSVAPPIAVTGVAAAIGFSPWLIWAGTTFARG